MHRLRPVCHRCVYWVEDHTLVPPQAGHCHRYPPGVYINPETGVVVQKFPTTDRMHWCGEWSDDDTRFAEAIRRGAAEAATGGA